MKTFSVIIPIGGHVVVDVDATSAEEAKEVAFSIAADALGRMIKDDEEQKARIENLELLEEFNKGNVCYCPSPQEIEADGIGPKMQEYVLDITSEPNFFAFCPCQGESVVTGMAYVQDRSPGPLVGVFSLNGQDHTNEWVKANPNFLERFGPQK